MLGGIADELADAGAQVTDSHPPVSFAEQIDVFISLIGPPVALEHARRSRRRCALARGPGTELVDLQGAVRDAIPRGAGAVALVASGG